MNEYIDKYEHDTQFGGGPNPIGVKTVTRSHTREYQSYPQSGQPRIGVKYGSPHTVQCGRDTRPCVGTSECFLYLNRGYYCDNHTNIA